MTDNKKFYAISKDGSTITNLTKIQYKTSLTQFAMLYFRLILKEEGCVNTKEGLVDYMEGWLVWSEEADETPSTKYSEMTDMISEHLVRSMHYLLVWDEEHSYWTNLSNEDLEEVERAIYEKLETIEQPTKV